MPKYGPWRLLNTAFDSHEKPTPCIPTFHIAEQAQAHHTIVYPHLPTSTIPRQNARYNESHLDFLKIPMRYPTIKVTAASGEEIRLGSYRRGNNEMGLVPQYPSKGQTMYPTFPYCATGRDPSRGTTTPPSIYNTRPGC